MKKYSAAFQEAVDKAVLTEKQKANGTIPGGDGKPWDGCVNVYSPEHGTGQVRIRAEDIDEEKHSFVAPSKNPVNRVGNSQGEGLNVDAEPETKKVEPVKPLAGGTVTK